VPKSSVYHHAKEHCFKMTKFDSNLLNEAENGYMISLFLGDGSFNRRKSEPRFFVRFALDAKRDIDVAQHLAEIVEKAGKRISFISWKSNIIVKTC
jgi:hypothetical protein